MCQPTPETESMSRRAHGDVARSQPLRVSLWKPNPSWWAKAPYALNLCSVHPNHLLRDRRDEAVQTGLPRLKWLSGGMVGDGLTDRSGFVSNSGF
jgi:hypothetical protein